MLTDENGGGGVVQRSELMSCEQQLGPGFNSQYHERKTDLQMLTDKLVNT